MTDEIRKGLALAIAMIVASAVLDPSTLPEMLATGVLSIPLGLALSRLFALPVNRLRRWRDAL